METKELSVRKADSTMQKFKINIDYDGKKMSKSLVFDIQTCLSQMYYECSDKLDMSDVSRHVTDILKLNYPKLSNIQVECL